MISEEDKYKAYTFNFAGFASITPFGKLVLENIKLFNDFGFAWFVIYCLASVFLLIAGLTFLEIGRSILCRRKL